MAQFEPAFKITMRNEGGFNPGVGEAMTYMGLDRSQHPNNPAWPIIDRIRHTNPGASVSALNRLFAADTELQNHIKDFYISDFWNANRLGDIKDQAVANICFDGAINPCEIGVGKLMQSCAAICGQHVVIDGVVGPATITAINSVDPKKYYETVIEQRALHYKDRVVRNPNMKQWLGAWLGRLAIPYSSEA